MRKIEVLFNDQPAGFLIEEDSRKYLFEYHPDYAGHSISWTLPTEQRRFEFEDFPSFFDGLLPEGPQLEALLRQAKLDRDDYLGQLLTVGKDLVGAVTVEEAPS